MEILDLPFSSGSSVLPLDPSPLLLILCLSWSLFKSISLKKMAKAMEIDLLIPLLEVKKLIWRDLTKEFKRSYLEMLLAEDQI